jgi:hypothetical protein
MIRTILGLCARDQGHDVMYQALDRALASYGRDTSAWKELVRSGEQQGLSSLLYKHLRALGFKLPQSSRRDLQSLYLRTKRSNQLRNDAIAEILAVYRHQQIKVLLVKGIALANFVYSLPELRPMRDIDLLVGKADLKKAQETLVGLGYRQQNDHDIADDYYHLAPMIKQVAGLPINIELHHNLLPFQQQYPAWPIEKSSGSAKTITVHNQQACTLNLEESLKYLYLHGLQAPLTYEEFRLIHVADIISLVEAQLANIDWGLVRRLDPQLLDILSRLHFITPWKQQVIDLLHLDLNKIPAAAATPYRGWPRRRLKDVGLRQLPALARDTFWPSTWWLQIYYGRLGGPPYWKVRFFDHPRAIWRWCKTYSLAFFKSRAAR